MTMRHYLGIAEPTQDGWSISFPAFPGAVTTGRSITELLVNARDALASVVAAMEEDGLPIPESVEAAADSLPSYDPADYRDPRVMLVSVEVGGPAIRINVTMEAGIVARLDNLAERSHVSRSALLAQGARMVLATAGAED